MSIIGVSSRWERKALEIIAKEEAPTLVKGQVLGRAESKWPRFDVYEFAPDREEFKDNPIILSGQEWSISLQVSMLQAIYQLLRGQKLDTENLGYFLGYPYEQYVYHNPAPLMVQIHWNIAKTYEHGAIQAEIKRNPKLKGYKKFDDRQLTIPNVPRSKITWESIKALVGNGYRYGPHYARVQMGEKYEKLIGKGGPTRVYSSSSESALKELKKLMTLSNSKGLLFTKGEEIQNEGQRAIDPNLQKPEIWLYPRSFTIINYKLVQEALQQGGGRGTAAGRKLRQIAKISLWPDTKPETADALIESALSYA